MVLSHWQSVLIGFVKVIIRIRRTLCLFLILVFSVSLCRYNQATPPTAIRRSRYWTEQIMLTTVKSLIAETHSEAESFCDWKLNRHLHRDCNSKLSVTVIVIKHEFFSLMRCQRCQLFENTKAIGLELNLPSVHNVTALTWGKRSNGDLLYIIFISRSSTLYLSIPNIFT